MASAPASRSSASGAGPARTTSAPPPTASAAVDRTPDEPSKLRAFLGILKRFIGVSDIAAVKFSLPAELLEPTPNLEYWNYLDRPDTFVSIGDSDEPLGRMLAALRFWYTKDLKYVKGKPCKPYNSALGEFFRCNWNVEDTVPPVRAAAKRAAAPVDRPADPSRTVRVSYLTEQTSHHPPVSAFFVDCPQKGITARGYDQLSARFTGTGVKVTPGVHNLGIFVTLRFRDDEEYRMTHPSAYLGGLLRGNLSLSVADTCYITCPKTRLKTILHYQEEGWLGRPQNRMTGAIYRYDPATDGIARLKDVPEKDILARLEGAWTDRVHYTLAGEKERSLLVDLNPMVPVPKTVPPEAEQLPNESLRFWADVTAAIKSKRYDRATQLKTELEERQREKVVLRASAGQEWRPRFFTRATAASGKPDLTEDGRLALKGLYEGNYHLEESAVTGA